MAVCTFAAGEAGEWRQELQAIRTDFAGSGADWAIEVAFADALLQVIDNQPAALPQENPYYPYLQHALDAIARFKSGAG